MMEHNFIDSRDDAVSESIGFLLIFTIVIMGIGLVTLYGYPMLLKQQSGADEQIMEKNMIVLQNDFKGLVYKTVPYKETALKIGGGSLEVNNFQTNGPTFRIEDSSGTLLMPDNKTGELSYQSTSTQEEISLQNGAVVKQSFTSSGSTMLAEPRWFYDESTQTMVINVVCINSSQHMSREGIGTVQMELGPTDYFKGEYPVGFGTTIHVFYTPVNKEQDYTLAWRNYFEKSMKMTCSGGTYPTPLSCTKNSVQTIVIKRTEVIINTI